MRGALSQFSHFPVSRRWWWLWFLTFSCSVASSFARADAFTLQISRDFTSANVAPLLQMLEDPTGIQTLEHIRQAPSSAWQATNADEFRANYSNSAFWLRVSLQANEDIRPHLRFMLDTDVAFLGYVDYHLINADGRVQSILTGLQRPYSARPYPAENLVLPIELQPGEMRTLYIRVASEGPIIFPAKLYVESEFHQYHVSKNLALGIFFSLCLILGLYNLFLFFALRDYSYLYYTLNTFVICWFQAAMRGFTIKYIWQDDAPHFSYVEPTFTLILIYLTSMLFSISFLKLKKNHPRLHAYFIGLTILCGAMLVASLVPPLHTLFMIQLYLSPILVTSSLIAALYSMHGGNRSARFFVLGWTIYLAGGFISSIYYQGFLPASLFWKEAVLFGSAIEGILLSIALADRIQLIQKENILAQKQIVAALEQSHKVKDEFLITISHELRTPLNGIIGALELNKHEPDPHRQQENLELIEESTRRMADAVDDLLCLSELNSGMAKVQHYSFHLHSRLQDVIAATEKACRQKGLSFTFNERFSSLHNHIGDADKLCLIFNVLLKNAVQFTERGAIHLSVEENFDAAQAGLAQLTVKVEDTGIGIEPAMLSQIFELFQQSSNGYNRSHEGLGVGLNICKSLTDLLGGKIEVTSTPMQGTCFTLTFEFQIDEEPARTHQSVEAHTPLALLVEDNEVNQKVLQKYLSKCGCETIIANTGLEALERVNERHPDIVFMDCQMPVMDGFEATRKLRAHYPRKNLPIIAVTANTMSNDRLRCIEAGMNDYLPKPIKLAQIESALNQWLPQKHTLASKKIG